MSFFYIRITYECRSFITDHRSCSKCRTLPMHGAGKALLPLPPQHHADTPPSLHISPQANAPFTSLSGALCSALGLKRNLLRVSNEAVYKYLKNDRDCCFKMCRRPWHREVSRNRNTTHLDGILQPRALWSI